MPERSVCIIVSFVVAGLLPFTCVGQVRVARTIRARSANSAPAQNSTSVQVPILGFVATDGGSALRPIFGIPGASLLGAPVALPDHTQNIAIAPGQAYSLVQMSNATEIYLLPISRDDLGPPSAIAGTIPKPDLLKFSPSATSAVLYSQQLNTAQVITDLPTSPNIAAQFNLSSLRNPVTALAVSDDGKAVLVGTSDGHIGELTVFAGPNSTMLMKSLGEPSCVKFLPLSYSAFMIDAQLNQVFVLNDVNGAFHCRIVATVEEGVNRPLDFQISSNQTRAFVANSGNQALLIIDTRSGKSISISCPFVPLNIGTLAGTSVFSLSGSAADTFGVFAAKPTIPRISVVPPIAYQIKGQLK